MMRVHQESAAARLRALVPRGAEAWSLAFALAVAAGVVLRLVLVAFRPLWADEVFTLALARKSVPALVRALSVDSGPPLHYLASRLVLAPFAAPGPADVLVRVLSLLASLAHVPLLLAIGRRTSHPRPRLSAALFLLVPLAVAYGAEGRAYALASLLVLGACERALCLAAGGSRGAAAALAALAAAAVLTHYLAAAPLAGVFLAAFVRADGASRRRLLAAGAGAILLAVAWLPVALEQPRAAMAWIGAAPRGDRLLAVLANLGLGLSPRESALTAAAAAGGAVLAAGLLAGLSRRSPHALAAACGLAVLAGLELASGAVLLPERAAVLFVPFLCLLAGELSAPASAALLALALAGNAVAIPEALRPTPAQQLAATLARALRGGGSVLAAGLWGPELSYRLGRAGLPGRVTLFPSDVARHPGWYAEGLLDPAELEAEARAAVGAGPPPRFVVFGPGGRAAAALSGELVARKGQRVAATAVLEVWVLPSR